MLDPPGFIEPCLPMISRTVPTGTGWAYEIKHDGFRFICRRDGDRVRCYSRGAHDRSRQLPGVLAALRTLPVTSVTLDGEIVICGEDGVSEFDRMPAAFGRHGSREAFLYAFDILELGGQDLRAQRWDARRDQLADLLGECADGVRLCEHIEDAEGAVVFRAGMHHGAGGHRRQAARQPLPLRTLPRLGEDQKYGAPGHRARHADRPE